MSIALSQTGESSVIDLEGAIDIGSASELKVALLDALKSEKGIVVTLRDVRDLDITIFQLLWAAGRKAKQAGLRFELAGELPECIHESLSAMGLDAKLICESVA